MSHNSNYAFTATFKDQEGNTTSGTDYTFAKAFTTGTASQTGVTRCNGTNCVVACSCNTANGWSSTPPEGGQYIVATTGQSFAYTASDGASYASYQTQLSGPSIEDGVTTSSYQTSLSSSTTGLVNANNGASYASILASNGASLAGSPALAAVSLKTLNGQKTCYKTTKPDCDEDNGYFFYEATEQDPYHPEYFDKVQDNQIYNYIPEYDSTTGKNKTYYNAEKQATEGCYKPVCRSGFINTSGYYNDVYEENRYRLVSAPYPGETNSYFTTPVRTFDTIAKNNGINCYIDPLPVTIQFDVTTIKTGSTGNYTYKHNFGTSPKFLSSTFTHHSKEFALGHSDQDDPKAYVAQDVTSRFKVTAYTTFSYGEYNNKGGNKMSAPIGEDPATWGDNGGIYGNMQLEVNAGQYSASTNYDTGIITYNAETNKLATTPTISYTKAKDLTFQGNLYDGGWGYTFDHYMAAPISRMYDSVTKMHRTDITDPSYPNSMYLEWKFVDTQTSVECPNGYYYYSDLSSQRDTSVYKYTRYSNSSTSTRYNCVKPECSSVDYYNYDDYEVYGGGSISRRLQTTPPTVKTGSGEGYDTPIVSNDPIANEAVKCYLPDEFPTRIAYNYRTYKSGLETCYEANGIDYLLGKFSVGGVSSDVTNVSDRFRITSYTGPYIGGTDTCNVKTYLTTNSLDINIPVYAACDSDGVEACVNQYDNTRRIYIDSDTGTQSAPEYWGNCSLNEEEGLYIYSGSITKYTFTDLDTGNSMEEDVETEVSITVDKEEQYSNVKTEDDEGFITATFRYSITNYSEYSTYSILSPTISAPSGATSNLNYSIKFTIPGYGSSECGTSYATYTYKNGSGSWSLSGDTTTFQNCYINNNGTSISGSSRNPSLGFTTGSNYISYSETLNSSGKYGFRSIMRKSNNSYAITDSKYLAYPTSYEKQTVTGNNWDGRCNGIGSSGAVLPDNGSDIVSGTLSLAPFVYHKMGTGEWNIGFFGDPNFEASEYLTVNVDFSFTSPSGSTLSKTSTINFDGGEWEITGSDYDSYSYSSLLYGDSDITDNGYYDDYLIYLLDGHDACGSDTTCIQEKMSEYCDIITRKLNQVVYGKVENIEFGDCITEIVDECPSGYYNDSVPNSTYFTYTTSNGCYKVTGCKSGYSSTGTGAGATWHGTTCKSTILENQYYQFTISGGTQQPNADLTGDPKYTFKVKHRITGSNVGNYGGSVTLKLKVTSGAYSTTGTCSYDMSKTSEQTCTVSDFNFKRSTGGSWFTGNITATELSGFGINEAAASGKSFYTANLIKEGGTTQIPVRWSYSAECPDGYFSEGIPIGAWAFVYAYDNPTCYIYTGTCGTGYTMSTTDTGGLCVGAPSSFTSGTMGYGKYCCKEVDTGGATDTWPTSIQWSGPLTYTCAFEMTPGMNCYEIGTATHVFNSNYEILATYDLNGDECPTFRFGFEYKDEANCTSYNGYYIYNFVTGYSSGRATSGSTELCQSFSVSCGSTTYYNITSSAKFRAKVRKIATGEVKTYDVNIYPHRSSGGGSMAPAQ